MNYENQLLPPKKAAEITRRWGITETALRRMLKEGTICGTVQIGKKTLINMEKLSYQLGISEDWGSVDREAKVH